MNRDGHSIARDDGFTLLEILITLTIVSILLSVTIPSGRQLVRQQESASVTNQIVSLLSFARETAVSSGYNTGVCPTLDLATCSNNWNQAFIVYKDLDGNKTFNPALDEALQVTVLPPSWSVNWRAFNSQYLIQFQPSGYTFNQNGTLEICPPFVTPSVNTLVLNRIGRLRQGQREYSDSLCANNA